MAVVLRMNSEPVRGVKLILWGPMSQHSTVLVYESKGGAAKYFDVLSLAGLIYL